MADNKLGGGKVEQQKVQEASTSSSSALRSILDGLAGASDVDCSQVCQAKGTYYQGYGMSSKGEVATYTCRCGGGVGSLPIQCVGMPFRKCCENECEGTQCATQAQGWRCPADRGCPEGNCMAADWQAWVAAHNVFRCMHDVPPVVWSNPVYSNTQSTFANQASMVHSDSYGVEPPAGPAGENLFQSWGYPPKRVPPMDAVHAWYSEVKDCGPFPGCEKWSTGVVGHFTALIWQGATSIGCMANSHNLQACQYKAQDYSSCHTPNFGGDPGFAANVYPRVRSYSECKSHVQACGLPVQDPSKKVDHVSGLWLDASNSLFEHFNSSQVGAVLLGGIVLAALTLGIRFRKQHRAGAVLLDCRE